MIAALTAGFGAEEHAKKYLPAYLPRYLPNPVQVPLPRCADAYGVGAVRRCAGK